MRAMFAALLAAVATVASASPQQIERYVMTCNSVLSVHRHCCELLRSAGQFSQDWPLIGLHVDISLSQLRVPGMNQTATHSTLTAHTTHVFGSIDVQPSWPLFSPALRIGRS